MDSAAQNNSQTLGAPPADIPPSPSAPKVADQKNHKKLVIILTFFVIIFLITIAAFIYLNPNINPDPTQQKIASLRTQEHPVINKPNIITVIILNKQTTFEGLKLDISPNILKINQVTVSSDTSIFIVLKDKITTGNLSDINKDIEVNIDCRFDPTSNQWLANKIFIFNDY